MSGMEWVKRHAWVTGFGLALIAAACIEGALLWHVRGSRGEAVRSEERLKQMLEARDELARLKERSRMELRRLPGGVRLSPEEVTAIAEKCGMAGHIGETRANPVRHDERLQEQVVVMTLNAVKQEELMNFLRSVEKIDPAVRTKTMQVTLSAGKAGLVDARVQIAAYE